MKKIKFAIIGAGYFANYAHYPSIQYIIDNPEDDVQVSVAGIWDVAANRAEKAWAEYRFGRLYRNLEEIKNDPSVDAFVILIDPSGLKEVVETLSKTGKPIFTEKPPGSSAAEAEYIANIVQAPNLVAFNRRFSQLNVIFRDLFQKLERPIFLDCQMYRYNRPDSNFVQGTGVHVINYLEYLAGPIQSVRALSGNITSLASSHRMYHAPLSFESGLEGQARFGQSTGILCERFEVHSTERSIYLKSATEGSVDYPGRITVYERGKLVDVIMGEEGSSHIHCGGFVAEYREFIRAIVYGEETRSNFSNAVNSMRVADAIEAGSELVLS